MVGATGIEPVTPTMSTSESPVLYVHIIVFIVFKDLVRMYKMYVQYLYYKCLHTMLYYNPSIRHIPNATHLQTFDVLDILFVCPQELYLSHVQLKYLQHLFRRNKLHQYQYNELPSSF